MSRLFGASQQLGLVVRDFMGTLEHWSRVQGVGPFYYFTDATVEDFRYRGAESPPPVLSIAFAYSGSLQIEIVHQQNDAPSLYREFLASGREGLNHISAFYDRPAYDDTHRRIREAGIPVWQEGAIGGVRFAYFQTEQVPGATICEISESDMDGPRQVFDMIRAASVDWDGSDPFRPLG